MGVGLYPPEEGIYYIVCLKSMMPIAVKNAGDGYNNLLIWPKAGTEGLDNRWRLLPIAEGSTTFTLQNVKTGHYMSVPHGKPSGTGLEENPKSGNFDFQWEFIEVDRTICRIQNTANQLNVGVFGGHTDEGTFLVQKEYTGADDQKWVLIPAGNAGGRAQTIDFSVEHPLPTDNYSLSTSGGCAYVGAAQCWQVTGESGFFKFDLYLPRKQGVDLVFNVGAFTGGQAVDCEIDLLVNDTLLSSFKLTTPDMTDVPWSVPASIMNFSKNTIMLSTVGGASKLRLGAATVDVYEMPGDQANWMLTIDSSIKISEINLPGTHDSAAISKGPTPYARQNRSITTQLLGGVRVLDVRLKIKKSGDAYNFVTCHGDVGSFAGLNEYQSFDSLLKECYDFLEKHPSEFIVMSLKIDDWNGCKSEADGVYQALSTLLDNDTVFRHDYIPLLQDVRGKMMLLNRMNNQVRLGTPLSWVNNTAGSYAACATNPAYKFYVQDMYEDLPGGGSDESKMRLVVNAMKQKRPNEIVFNFASATRQWVFNVRVIDDLLAYFGSKSRPLKFGWILFDYIFEEYETDTYDWINIVQIIVASNFGYSGFDKKFEVKQAPVPFTPDVA